MLCLCRLETLETRQLYLGNIGVTVTVEDIHTVFRDYNIEEARIPADRDRGVTLMMDGL